MIPLELAVEELASLPPTGKQAALCMSPDEANAFQRRIDEDCARIGT